tara:strand:- start:864 stop:1010 length:147 start_codon:yes stop_codon:yes gene_type:complete
LIQFNYDPYQQNQKTQKIAANIKKSKALKKIQEIYMKKQPVNIKSNIE